MKETCSFFSGILSNVPSTLLMTSQVRDVCLDSPPLEVSKIISVIFKRNWIRSQHIQVLGDFF